jgi:hypothetical protein
MKISLGNQKPKLEDSFSDEENTNQKKKNNNQNTSKDILLKPDDKSLFKRPGTTIKPIIKNRLVSNKDVTKDANKAKEVAETTISSNRFNFVTDNCKNQQKKLDNSYEDYWLYEIVDDDSFNKFKQLVIDYISKRLYDKTVKLYMNLRKQLSDTISKDLNHIHLYYDLIKKIEKNHSNNVIKEKSCFESLCKCFIKKKKKNRLSRNFNLTNTSIKITNDLMYLIDEIKNNFNEKAIEGIFPTPTEETKAFCDEKAKKFLDKPAIEERLREEVEYYSKYLKIENIIEKQKNTLETQKEKKKKISEIRELNVCIICLEFQRNIMFSPCNHLICCEKCANEVKEVCPACQKKFDDKIDINS